ncbi:hypothetical protein [Aurantiacibacter aquimixticola]|uniref:DUF883 family protein n=1 Tax=Aurantiacibacter aquimixticola TaxID=1958945 RepID=A0A419RRL0_9SPHN|nr:hypothetical protein [Aurantiacibacter aquimixticola]RJY08421.1 hypothetical protein D6201_02755 [Aurantiacibacter aquimixticola]
MSDTKTKPEDLTPTTKTTPTTEEKREEIKARIAAAQEREASRSRSYTERATEVASDAGEAFTDFVKKHPIASAVGGVALGVLIAGMFKGPRQAAVRGGTKAVGLAAVGAEIASGFASQLMDDAQDLGRSGARKAEDLADTAGDRARSLKRSAKHTGGDAADAARIARRETGKAIARALGRK